MSRQPSHYRGARGLSVAVAGLFLGHLLIYRIVYPNSLQRAVLLARTGHSYLPSALGLGVTVAALAAVATFARGFRRGAGAHRRTRLRPGTATWAMVVPALAQAGAFMVLETAERLLAGAPLAGLAGLVLPLGVLLQLAMGAAGGAALYAIDHAAEALATVLSTPRPAVRRVPTSIRCPDTRRPLAARRVSPLGIRGPPALA